MKATLQKIKAIGNDDSVRRDIAGQTKITYREFTLLSRVQEAELNRQRNEELLPDAPFFSVLVPLYNTPDKFLKEMLESVLKQTYGKWELCLADGSDEDCADHISEVIRSFDDPRIRYKKLDHNGGISENTNAALKMAKGDFIVLFDHDDLLAENALYEFAHAIMNDNECDCIYSDEDKIDSDTGNLFDPHFKPDYNIDMLCSVNYICHLFAVRKVLVDQYGGFDPSYDGAQDHDFILRMTEKARHTVHIPKILYHWRSHQNSTAANPESKLYAFEAGKKAILAHYERVWPELKIDSVEKGISYGIYHTKWHFDEYPLISVIIPNMDHTKDLDKAIRSMNEKGTWPNKEFIVIENNSKLDETFTYYDQIQKEYENVHVVRYAGEFNYSKINNFGARFAKGDYYLLMNNDIELIEPDSVREMMGYCQREDVGIVGARLLYEDDTIQHAGVVVGIGGIAGHAFKYRKSENDTYFNRAMVAQDYSAVTAAVMLVKKSVFDEVNGLDESFVVALNDIDFCLRVRQTGKLVVYTPYACFHHYESKSRGLEDTEEKQARFRSEISRFVDRYHDFLQKGDPYYNPNLSLLTEDFSMRNLRFETIGEPFYTKREVKTYEQIAETESDQN
ncbi:MAG: glycosyltransferase [Bulleidia sp.]